VSLKTFWKQKQIYATLLKKLFETKTKIRNTAQKKKIQGAEGEVDNKA
jgi:hypothetical protein